MNKRMTNEVPIVLHRLPPPPSFIIIVMITDNAVQGRHCRGNFSDPNRLFRSLNNTWGSQQATGQQKQGGQQQEEHVSFDHVCLDYFFSPQGWAGDRWTNKFFTGTLPSFCMKEWLKVNGSVWLPNIKHVSEVIYICTYTYAVIFLTSLSLSLSSFTSNKTTNYESVLCVR